jgi:AmmeMemoRadiSam system protein A
MNGPFSEDERRRLLDLARRAIEARVRGEAPSADAPQGLFRERRGAFVTLRRREDGALRGCIGYPEPTLPLAEAVVRGAEAAATADSRFAPVGPDELDTIRIEISVLSPLKRVRPEDVRVGVDGLVVQNGGRRGLLLPQVAPEWGWDRETFLSETCRKAGLPRDSWKQPETDVFAFQALVMGED